MTSPVRILLAALLLVSGFSSEIADAQLLGLTHDAGASQVAEIDSASLSTPVGGPQVSTTIGYTATTFDPFTGAIFALGPDPVTGDGTTALFSFDATTGVRSLVGNTGSTEQVAALRYELATMRLIAALVDPVSGVLRLASVDNASAALTTINTGVSDCCAIELGATSTRTGDILLLGRRTSDSDTERYLIALSTTGDNESSLTLLDGPVSIIQWDRLAARLYGVRQQGPAATGGSATAQLGAIDRVGTFTPVGPAVNDCCALVPGVSALALSTPGSLYTVGSAVGGNSGIIDWNLTGGDASIAGALPVGAIVNGLFDPATALTPSMTTIDSVVPNSLTVGESYTVTATATSIGMIDGGIITVDDGHGVSCSFPVSMAAPTGSCTLQATQAGTPTVIAVYSGTVPLAPSFDTAIQTVARIVSVSSIIDIAPSPVEVGQPYEVSVTVSGFNPTGTIDIDDGQGETCQIVLPATGCVLTTSTVGARTITADYPGDVNNMPSSAMAVQDVVRAPSTTSIDSIMPEPSVVGDAYAVNVTVTGFNPTGTVAIDDGAGNGCSIVLPATSCLIANNGAGTLTVTAAYPGDSNNIPSSASAPHVVNATPTATSIDLLDPSPVVVGQAYTVVVSVTGFGPPTGSVAVADDNGASCIITLPDTSCDLTSTAAGTRTISADYSGDADNQPSSDSTTQDVTLASTSLSLTTDSSMVPQGSPVELTALLTDGFDPVTGTVDFFADGSLLSACADRPVTNGEALCTTSFRNQGVFFVTAEYSGDGNNQPATSPELLIRVSPLIVPSLSRAGLVTLLMMLAMVATVALRRRQAVE